MKKDVTELSRFIGYRDVAVDQYSGEIARVGWGEVTNPNIFGIQIIGNFDVLLPIVGGWFCGYRVGVRASPQPTLLQKRQAKRLSRS
ncbi:MAG: hypothetical protein M0R33_24240 [Methylomonas sp.]|jgi:hypothetical protein|uniref:hypothetical protein n=1 Tax=Methylomonas sp. TaxID=418 RepID=UPI0025EB9EA8|nr:hypothetical protein [Methylomonas sp.]MCK9609551.1 hypothetical protein [Methylomonas sp.]